MIYGMKSVIILHGMPTKEEFLDKKLPNESNAHWLPWLQKQLLMKGVMAYTPDMPKPYAPDYDAWVREVERYEIGPQTAIVGHSCGGGFWVRYLSEHKKLKVGKVVLVAPWLDPDGDEAGSFFDFEMDQSLAKRTKGLVIFNSANDMGNVHKSVALLRENIDGMRYREFKKRGHFDTPGMKSDKFPELLKELV